MYQISWMILCTFVEKASRKIGDPLYISTRMLDETWVTLVTLGFSRAFEEGVRIYVVPGALYYE